MNLYIRYFDSETLVDNVDSAVEFLASIPEVGMNNRIAMEVKDYFESDIRFPKRYKVRPRVYFIMIKTDAKTMQEFKDHRNKPADNSAQDIKDDIDSPKRAREREAEALRNYLYGEKHGWYEVTIDFKRVVTIPETGKHEYRDCHFVAQVKANSGIDCYNIVVEHLKSRVDSRSQFPSAKGHNFSFTYLGATKESVFQE